MKIFSLLIFIALLSLVACGEKEDLSNAEVEINCTGTYLSIDNLYYKVCNTDLLQDKVDGDKISVHVIHLDECDEKEPNETVCLMAFQNDGFVKILYQY